MDWNAIINWPGITMLGSVVTAGACYIVREVQHKRTARFNLALSKIYSAIERYIRAANQVKENINTMPLDYILERKAEKIDEWITLPIFEMENVALLTGMFFSPKDRRCFIELSDAARDFKFEVHKAYQATNEIDKLNIYDKGRTDFNKRYDSAMKKMADMLHDRILGKWEHDFSMIRLSAIQRTILWLKRDR
jgi:hypothetical protein